MDRVLRACPDEDSMHEQIHTDVYPIETDEDVVREKKELEQRKPDVLQRRESRECSFDVDPVLVAEAGRIQRRRRRRNERYARSLLYSILHHFWGLGLTDIITADVGLQSQRKKKGNKV